MKLLACHIENFGTLSHFDYTFTDGMNIICHPNGWGKTTFAAFLKAMLYGLPASRVQSLLENERARYKPWQEGAFGGWLTFSVGEKTYRVERYFKAKASEDTFALFDTATNLPSDDYQDMPLGVALFGVDAESFERSTYLSERSEHVKADYTDVQAKLVDMEDFVAFDKAMKKLNERRNHYHKSSKAGSIITLTEALYQAQEAVRVAQTDAIAYASLSAEGRALKDKQMALMKRRDDIETLLRQNSELKLQDSFRDQAERLHQATLLAEAEAKRMGEGLPTAEGLDDMADVIARLEAEEQAQSAWQVAYDQRERAEAEVRSKAEAERKAQEAIAKQQETAFEKQRKTEKTYLFFELGVTLISAIIGFALPVLFVLAGVGLIASGYMAYKMQTHTKKASQSVATITTITAEDTHPLPPHTPYATYQADKDTLATFLEAHPVPHNPLPSLDVVKLHIAQLKEQIAMWEAAKEKATLAKGEEDRFLEAHPICSAEPTADTPSADTLQAEQAEIVAALHEIAEQLQQNHREAGRMALAAEALPRHLQEVATLEDQIPMEQEHLDIISATMDYLKQSKEQLTASYLDGVQEIFSHYVATVAKMDADTAKNTYELTPSFEVQVRGAGGTHKGESVSRGTRDLLALCLKLALRDKIFTQQEPPLLLDDPFLSFDDTHVGTAKELLALLAKDKQIVYFTCHSARA